MVLSVQFYEFNKHFNINQDIDGATIKTKEF